MLERILYRNHMNETIQLGEGGFYVNENDLRNFTWAITKKNDRISAFSRGVASRSIPVVIVGPNRNALADRLFEICEKDVLTKQHGELHIGEYYMRCFVTASKKKSYLQTANVLNMTLTITSDYPYWVRETITTFNYGAGAQGTNLDFNNDFPYDYTSNLLSQKLNNTDFVPSNFRMNVYGPCENPCVTVSGHDYEVAVTLLANEYLTIDSVDKTIILTHTDGQKENCFNLRNRDSYIFEKMPVGINNVSNNGDFKFDITLLEERSEPRWI